jgi:hypothetical protein
MTPRRSTQSTTTRRLRPLSASGRIRTAASGRARRLGEEDGFTMLFALLALFVGALLVAAAFSAANGDIKLTKQANLQARAYYAAVAGVERYQYELTSNPNYWVKCPKRASTTVTGTTDEKFTYRTLGSASAPNGCTEEKQSTILETSGNANGTFRVLSVGSVEYGGKKTERKIVATFAHPGFTKYVYESNYELEDPANFEPEPTYCEHYYKYRKEHSLTGKCSPIEFAPTDEVKGPMHTNDAAAICAEGTSKPKFGRNSEDSIEMVEGHYAYPGCSDSPNIVGKYTEGGATLLPPETDSELLESAGLKTSGRTVLKLKAGTPNTMEVTTSEGTTTTSFPNNGVVYVQNSSSGCGLKYTPFNSDTENDSGCGNVYVSGTYSESLTIASANDVIINGSLTTTGGSEGGEPTGGATLGLIAENFVRVYHPVKRGYETTNVVAETEPPVAGKCVTLKEAEGRLLRNEISEINTAGITSGSELAGPSSLFETGTTVSGVKESEKKLTLSKTSKVPAVEVEGKVTRASEITELSSTTGVESGDEVVSGSLFETGTTITELKEKTVKLSKAGKAGLAKTVSSSLKSGKTEVTMSSSSGLLVGQEVEGTGIQSGTIISKVETGKIILSKTASATTTTNLKFYGEKVKIKVYGEKVKVKFYVPTGFALNSALNLCHKVEKTEGNPYDEYIESENRYIADCESRSSYTSKGFCEYTENTSSGCTTKATNLNASEDPNGWGVLENPYIDAAILSTKHSFIVDNWKCGSKLGKLTVWGSIAQFWRGPVGTGGGTGGSGYIKNYTYDERLATQQPPSFLSPSSTSWSLSRETAPPAGFCSNEKC